MLTFPFGRSGARSTGFATGLTPAGGAGPADEFRPVLRHYTSIFPNSSMGRVTRYGPDMPPPMKEGDVMTVDFTLDGQPYTALNGGPQFPFSEAISFQIRCADQQEADHYWNRLAEGDEESMCGWLKDGFAVSWQVTPVALVRLLTDPHPGRAQRATQAMLRMRGIDLAEVQRAADSSD